MPGVRSPLWILAAVALALAGAVAVALGGIPSDLELPVPGREQLASLLQTDGAD